MPHQLIIRINGHEWAAELNETGTAANLLSVLPIEAEVSRWGQEIYFTIAAEADDTDPTRTQMERGELAFWPPGKAFCIFWGRTPASRGDKPVAASAVVPIGRLTAGWDGLDRVDDGTPIQIEGSR